MENHLRWFSEKATDGHSETFRYKDGPVFSDSLSEELDSGMVIINRIPKKEFEAFDVVEINNNNFNESPEIPDSITLDNGLVYRNGGGGNVVSANILHSGTYKFFSMGFGIWFKNSRSPEVGDGAYRIVGTGIPGRYRAEFAGIITEVDYPIKSKTMLIESVVETQVGFDPDIFDYTLKLMSLTKKLERTDLPNWSETKPLEGDARTLDDVIGYLVNNRSPKSLFRNHQGIEEYTQDYGFYAEGDDVKCPDMQVSESTLRESVDRLLSVRYGICKLNKHGGIECVKLNQKRNKIVLSEIPEINYKNENQSSTDFASELETNYQNVIPNKESELQNFSTVSEFIGFRNTGEGITDDNNIQLETQFPIYNIKKVIVYVGVKVDRVFKSKFYKYDITNYVRESENWSLLTPGNVPTVHDTSSSYWSGYWSTNCVFYKRGDNKIDNWMNRTKKVVHNWNTFELLLRSKHSGHGEDVKPDNYIEDTMFEIEYETQASNIKLRTGKYLPESSYNNVVIDNQQEAYVDISQQGRLFNQKINRLGNRCKVITGRFSPNRIHKMPRLGDYLDNYVVINTEIQYYDNFVNYKAILSENFVNINYFTGINARRRGYQIVQEGQAFDKQLLDKWYCEFSFEQKNNEKDEALLYDNHLHIPYRMINVFNYQPMPVTKCFVTNPYIEDIENNVNYIQLDIQSYMSGNSVAFKFGFLSNVLSAQSSLVKRIQLSGESKPDFNNVDGGYSPIINTYCDDGGYLNSDNGYYEIILLNDNYKVAQGTSTKSTVETLLNAPEGAITTGILVDDEKVLLYQGSRPRIFLNENTLNTVKNDNGIWARFNMIDMKDSREKVGFNVQFEFCSDTPNIIVGREFIKRQQMISRIAHQNDYEVYISDEPYDLYDETLHPGSTSVTSGTTIQWNDFGEGGTIAPAYLDIIVTGLTFEHKSVAIVDNTDEHNLILAVNDVSNTTRVYLNLLKTRDRKIYINHSKTEWQDVENEKFKRVTSNEELTSGYYLILDNNLTKVFNSGLSIEKLHEPHFAKTINYVIDPIIEPDGTILNNKILDNCKCYIDVSNGSIKLKNGYYMNSSRDFDHPGFNFSSSPLRNEIYFKNDGKLIIKSKQSQLPSRYNYMIFGIGVGEFFLGSHFCYYTGAYPQEDDSYTVNHMQVALYKLVEDEEEEEDEEE